MMSQLNPDYNSTSRYCSHHHKSRHSHSPRQENHHCRADSFLEQCQEHPNGQNEEDGKKNNYQLLVLDLSSHGYSTKFLTLKIGCLGHYIQDTFTTLKAAAPLVKGVTDVLLLLKQQRQPPLAATRSS